MLVPVLAFALQQLNPPTLDKGVTVYHACKASVRAQELDPTSSIPDAEFCRGYVQGAMEAFALTQR